MNRFSYLSLCLLLAAASEAQELKVYDGPYTINGKEGHARYQYKDAPDGTRIFHGDFTFNYDGSNDYYNHDASAKAYGKFIDNHQVGVWNWEGDWYLGFSNPNQKFSYTFNDAGFLEGKATYYGGPNDVYELTIKDGKISGAVPFISPIWGGTMKATWKNGHLVGDYIVEKSDPDSGYRFVTKGQFDEYGTPCGSWTEEETRGTQTRKYYYPNVASGYHIPGYYFEESTGDKISVARSFQKVSFIPALFRKRGDFVLRDSGGGKVFELVELEQKPQFPGGEGALMRWVASNLRYPEEAQENNIQGRVYVTFIVERDGSVTNPEITRSVDPALDKEAIRVVRKMPKWDPGKNNGAAVRSYYTIPMTFNDVLRDSKSGSGKDFGVVEKLPNSSSGTQRYPHLLLAQGYTHQGTGDPLT